MRAARLVAALGGILLGLHAGPAAAYTWYLVDGGQGAPLRWFRTAVSYRLGTVDPEEVPAADVADIVDGAFGAWEDLAGCGIPEVTYAGTTEATARTVPKTLFAPPDNIIVFVRTTEAWLDEGHARTWIAITSIAHDSATGEIVDADIEVNDGTYRFSAGDGPPDASWIDLVSTLTHEVGHFFGMDHSLVPNATMFRTYDQEANPTGGRTLEPDDADGICALYADVPPHVARAGDRGCAGGGGPGSLAVGLGLLALVARRRRRRQPY